MGTAKEGNRLSVLQSLICKMPKPDAAINVPPTIEISVTIASGITPPASLAAN